MGGLGDLWDDFTGKSAADRASEGYSRAFESTKNKENFLNELFGKLESSINESYGQALGSVGALGESGRADILGREATAMGGANQSLTSRGLGNTTVLEGANRGIMSDTNRDLTDLGEAMAGLRSNLQIGQGQALGQAYMGRYGALSDIYDTRAGLHLGKGQLASGSLGEWIGGNFENVSKGVGALAGMFI